MLILTRGEGEAFYLGEGFQVVIRVLEVRGRGAVRIGIEAPPTVEVLREELYWRLMERLQAEEDRRRREAGQDPAA